MTSTLITGHLTLRPLLSAGAEGETPCRVEAGVESEKKSPERVNLPTGPTRDGLRAHRQTDGKQE